MTQELLMCQINDGLRGGRVRVRAKISIGQANLITQIPFSTNTTTLIDSILKANEKVKSKSRKLKTIPLLRLRFNSSFPGVSPDKTIDALFAFTACRKRQRLWVVIEDNKPLFIGVSEMLKISTKELLIC
jgi:topoisomerase-4 subunit A